MTSNGFSLAQWRELAYRNFRRLRDANTDAAQAQVTAEVKRTLTTSAGGFATGVQLPARH